MSFPNFPLQPEEKTSAQRYQAASCGPDISLIEAPLIDADGAAPDNVGRLQLAQPLKPEIAESLSGGPLTAVEEFGFPHRVDHRELWKQHQVGRVAFCVLTQLCPGSVKGSGLVGKFTHCDAHAVSVA
jgi:hypothetical protein